MPLPLRHLPIAQNWDCQGCGTCCHEYQIFITDEERGRIESQGWDKDPAFANTPLFVRRGPWWMPRYRLNQRPNGACVFLSEQGRCQIHERFGGKAKPLPCQLYPFVLIPAGDQWRVGVRFSCPSSVANLGRPQKEHQADLKRFATDLERQVGRDISAIPPPPLRNRQSVPWPDLFRFVETFQSLVERQDEPLEFRLRKCLALVAVCRQARFDDVRGGRLVEFLKLMVESLEVPPNPAGIGRPTPVGRLLFRQLTSVYARRDQGPNRGPVHSRLGLLTAASRFAVGRGPVPRLHAWIPEGSFAGAETPSGSLNAASTTLLERFYLTKLASLQFCGPSNFHFAFWHGLESLALTFPIIRWLARLQRHLPQDEAIGRAVGMVDYHFGYNEALGGWRHVLAQRILRRRGDLEKLIAWYSL